MRQQVTEFTYIRALDEMFKKAEEEGLWFHSQYDQIWISPAQLKKRQEEGMLRWGPQCWTLRKPQERVKQIEEEIASLTNRLKNLKQEISCPNNTHSASWFRGLRCDRCGEDAD